ncbi:beta-D-glucosyl crocetin beta-1,6-glucosyltransferase-like [Andrographis paniculata]|uniref:beta-D-glucosyl crocetin beta-1,6-glucosyltransferase-like n=1 Tax=Andrographis paniculata TaxID=175694 RepID=UPI0021E8A3AB|nr:beta-D-glucosyl crocetin beta-1,6-glucosyltransferase-like [Andrographis paniculata]
MDSEEKCFKVFMFPWLAHGHISPFIDLARNLAGRNFRSYICSTPANLSSIEGKICRNNYSGDIRLVELHLPSTHPELPPQRHTTNGLPLSLHSSLRKALKAAKPSFSNILDDLRPDLVIHDVVLPWAGTIASRRGIPSVAFFTSGATMFSYFCHLGMRPGIEFPFPAIHLSEYQLSKAHANVESATSKEKDADDEAYQTSDGIILVNTSMEIEGKYVDYLSKMIKKEIVAVGALVRDPIINRDEDAELMEWLGAKEQLSTVLVSFGSEYFLNKDEIEELAHGLESSNLNFIWVIRFAKGEEIKIEDVLPRGFLEKIGERGRIVENWAPQAKILSHESVGGFVSHCGWNSLKESIDYGVPIIAMPMHLDQPMNAKLVVELGVGIEVRRDEKGRLDREEISKVIERVIFEKIGEDLRSRIGELRESIKMTSKEEFEVIVKKLEQLCARKDI